MFSSERNFVDWHLSGFGDAPAFLFKSLESTHSLMKQQATTGEILPGTLIVADTQTAGRGRHERTWDSPAGLNLYFNILIPLDGIPLASAPQITQVAALIFAEVFKGLQDDANAQGHGNTSLGKVTVKWPNDILCGKSKFCGILAELVYIKPTVNSIPKPAISMGVGINVNSDSVNYAHLIANLERAIGQFRAFGIRPWVAAWKRMDQFIGARGTIIVNNHCTDQNRDSGAGAIKKTGAILDMQDDGSLLFKCDDGTIETVYSADLEI